MNQYTGMFIISPTLTDDGYKQVVADFRRLFEDHQSQVIEVKEWGMKDLAYEINDFKKGYYVVLKVNATPEAVSEYDRICNIREDIIRHIIVKD
jgi:small subunit ribosomal protein S6